MFINLLKKHKQLLLFCINGGIMTLIHLSIYYLLWQVNSNLFVNNMIAFLFAFSVNYFSQLIIFSTKTSVYVFLKYFLSQLVLQSINGVILNIFSQVHLIFLMICIQTYTSYMLNKKIVFISNK